jgi:hypothetical protein
MTLGPQSWLAQMQVRTHVALPFGSLSHRVMLARPRWLHVTTLPFLRISQLHCAGNKYRPDLVDWASVIQAVRVICNYESRICNW